MSLDFEPMGDGDDLWEVCAKEDEWNDALQESPEVIERELDIHLKEPRREDSDPFDGRNIYIDIHSEIYGTDDGSIVIETQDKGSDHLDNDHAFRALRYANESESEILVYVAESFGEYTQNLLERMNREMEIQIFGLVPNIIPKGEGGYQVGFERSVSPNDWEEFRENMILGSNIQRDQVYIFDMLEEELKQSGLPNIKRRKLVPEHSGYYCSKPKLEGGFEVYYSVKKNVRVGEEAMVGQEFKPGNINFRVQITDDSDHDPEDLYDKNYSLLDSVFDEWGVLKDTWANSIVITVTSDLNVGNHREIAQWFAQRREDLNQIYDDLTLDI